MNKVKIGLAGIVLLMALVLCTMAVGQRVEMDCSYAKLWLGMPKADALKALHDAGYDSYADFNGEHGELGFKNSAQKQYCRIAFTSNSLSYAERLWSDVNTASDAVAAVINALTSVAEKRQTCRVSPHHTDSRCDTETRVGSGLPFDSERAAILALSAGGSSLYAWE